MPKFSNPIVYWADVTGLDWEADEIIQLSMVNLNGDVIFSHLFKPTHIKVWDPSQQGINIYPQDVVSKVPITHYLSEIQAIFDKADLAIGFDNYMFDDHFLCHVGIELSDTVRVDFRKQLFEQYQLFDHYPSIFECASYFNYPLNKQTTHYTNYAKAVSYCYKQVLMKHN